MKRLQKEVLADTDPTSAAAPPTSAAPAAVEGTTGAVSPQQPPHSQLQQPQQAAEQDLKPEPERDGLNSIVDALEEASPFYGEHGGRSHEVSAACCVSYHSKLRPSMYA